MRRETAFALSACFLSPPGFIRDSFFRREPQSGLEQVESIVGNDPGLGAAAVGAEDAPKRAAVGAHPFWRERAYQPLAVGSHAAEIFEVTHSGPRAPGSRAVKHAQLAGAAVERGQKKAMQGGSVIHGADAVILWIDEHGLRVGKGRSPERLTAVVETLEEFVGRRFSQAISGDARQVDAGDGPGGGMEFAAVEVHVAGESLRHAGN
jgi:hypothetical protein